MYFPVADPYASCAIPGTYSVGPATNYRSTPPTSTKDFSAYPSMKEIKDCQMAVLADRSYHIQSGMPFPDLVFTMQELIDGLARLQGHETSIPAVYLAKGVAAQAIGGPHSRCWRLVVVADESARLEMYRTAIFEVTRQLINDKINQTLKWGQRSGIEPFRGDPQYLATVYGLKHHYHQNGWSYLFGPFITLDVAYHLPHYTGSSHLDGWLVSYQRKLGMCSVKDGAYMSSDALDQAAQYVYRRQFHGFGSNLLVPILNALSDGSEFGEDQWNRARMEFVEMDGPALERLWFEMQSACLASESGMAMVERIQWIDFLHLLLLVKDDTVLCEKAINTWDKTHKALHVISGISFIRAIQQNPALVPHLLNAIQGMAFFTWLRTDHGSKTAEQKMPCRLLEAVLKERLHMPVDKESQSYAGNPLEMWTFEFNKEGPTRPCVAIPCGTHLKRFLILAGADEFGTPLAVSERFCASMRFFMKEGLAIHPLQSILTVLGFCPVPAAGFESVIATLAEDWKNPRMQTFLASHFSHLSPITDPYTRHLQKHLLESVGASIVLPKPALPDPKPVAGRVSVPKPLPPHPQSKPKPAVSLSPVARVPPSAQVRNTLSRHEWPSLNKSKTPTHVVPRRVFQRVHSQKPVPQRFHPPISVQKPQAPVTAPAPRAKPAIQPKPTPSPASKPPVALLPTPPPLPLPPPTAPTQVIAAIVTVEATAKIEATPVVIESTPPKKEDQGVVPVSSSKSAKNKKAKARKKAKQKEAVRQLSEQSNPAPTKVSALEPEKKNAGPSKAECERALIEGMFALVLSNSPIIDDALLLQTIDALSSSPEIVWTPDLMQRTKRVLILASARPSVLKQVQEFSSGQRRHLLTLTKGVKEMLKIQEVLTASELNTEGMRLILATLSKVLPFYQTVDKPEVQKIINALYERCFKVNGGKDWADEILRLQDAVDRQALFTEKEPLCLAHSLGLCRLVCRHPLTLESYLAINRWMRTLHGVLNLKDLGQRNDLCEFYGEYLRRLMQQSIPQANMAALQLFFTDRWAPLMEQWEQHTNLEEPVQKTLKLSYQLLHFPFCVKKLTEATTFARLKAAPAGTVKTVLQKISQEASQEEFLRAADPAYLLSSFTFAYRYIQGLKGAKIDVTSVMQGLAVHLRNLLALQQNLIKATAKRRISEKVWQPLVADIFNFMKEAIQFWKVTLSADEELILRNSVLSVATQVLLMADCPLMPLEKLPTLAREKMTKAAKLLQISFQPSDTKIELSSHWLNSILKARAAN